MAKVLGFLQPCLSVWSRCWVALGSQSFAWPVQLRLVVIVSVSELKICSKVATNSHWRVRSFQSLPLVFSFLCFWLYICRLTEAEVLAPYDTARTKSSPSVLADFNLTQLWAICKRSQVDLWQTDYTDCYLLWEGPWSQWVGPYPGQVVLDA